MPHCDVFRMSYWKNSTIAQADVEGLERAFLNGGLKLVNRHCYLSLNLAMYSIARGITLSMAFSRGQSRMAPAA